MDGVISREVNPMKKMEYETILCTQCKVIMEGFRMVSRILWKGSLGAQSLNSSFGGNWFLVC